eukprot:861542-Amorphochlora_amoeboformis.AAC.1
MLRTDQKGRDPIGQNRLLPPTRNPVTIFNCGSWKIQCAFSTGEVGYSQNYPNSVASCWRFCTGHLVLNNTLSIV